MRQFLAATLLVAVIGLPAAYLLGGASAPRAIAQNATGKVDPAAAIIDGMHRIAAGLAASLSLPRGRSDTGIAVAPTAGAAGAGALTLGLSRSVRSGADHGVVALAGETGPGGSTERDEAGAAASAKPVITASVVAPADAVFASRNAPPGFAGFGLPLAAIDLMRTRSGVRGLSRDYPTSFTWFNLA